MQQTDFPEVPTELIKEEVAKETANTLNLVNYQIAELIKIKENLELRLSEMLDHGEDGQHTYTVDKFKVTIRSGFIYSLNKEEYELIGNHLPSCFKPVKSRVAYDVDKKAIKDIEKYGSKDDLNILSKFISKKPSKLHIKITAGV